MNGFLSNLEERSDNVDVIGGAETERLFVLLDPVSDL